MAGLKDAEAADPASASPTTTQLPPASTIASTPLAHGNGTTSGADPHFLMTTSAPGPGGGGGGGGGGPRPRRELNRRPRKSDAESSIPLEELEAPTTPSSRPSTPPPGDAPVSSSPFSPDMSASTRVLDRVPTILQPSLPWRDRLMHFTFAWYTVTMSTSGVALTLALVPYRFQGLSYIGLTLFLLDVAFFILISTAILARFVLYRPTFRRAFTRPSEALFVPTLFLSIAAMLSNAAEYARIFLPASQVERLARGFLRPAFWVYLGLSFMCSVLQYHLLFTVKKPARRLRVDAMTPAWILPVFPVMLAGTLAPACARNLADARQSVAILAAGLAAQGLGWAVSGFMYATYLSRLMVFGLPVQRPGMFIAVGPPSFTCSALVTMAGEVPRVLVGLAGLAAEEVNQGGRTLSVWAVAAGLGEADIRTLAAGVQMLATCTAVFLWGLSFWFFATATAAVVAGAWK
ncbi:hypothetical protein VTJ04DRAFT_2008 [Mycothermus thermophilus]|uniref:uncharacterized protein n=1 Tax=Humicola insolens TaxID=85995 RepID=UPI0037436F10